MQKIKLVMLASVAAIALSNNAMANELLIDSKLLESEVKQNLQINLDTLNDNFNTQQQAEQLLNGHSDSAQLLANNQTQETPEVTE